jgi:ferredoxin
MKVSVDHERCEGHGRCYSLAPELFEPDEIGNSQTKIAGKVPRNLEAKARRAEANCPERAVVVGADG